MSLPIVTIGSRRELFVDTLLVDRMENTRLTLHEPVAAGAAIAIDRPWEERQYPITVIFHNSRYLMYYGTKVAKDDNFVMAVAVSDDGVAWSKPNLGLAEYAGHSDMNITVDENGQPFYGITWLDTRPGVPEDERIKAVTTHVLSGARHTARHDPNTPKRMVLWTSADGYTFRKRFPQTDFVSSLNNSFDGGISLFWSDAEQAYVLYYRIWDGDIRGGLIPGAEMKFGKGYRSMARTTSKDLVQWSDPVPMSFDTPREQFYTNQTVPYFRAPHLYIAPAARFMEGRSALSEQQAAAIGLEADPYERNPEWLRHDCSDAVLLTSRAGTMTYDRTFMETFIRPGLGYENWVSRTNYPFTGVFPCGNRHMMLFVSRHAWQPSWYVERLLLRLDGFASITAPWTGGEFVTRPLLFSGDRLEVNYRTSAAGFVKVGLLDADGNPIPGYGLDDSKEMIGDEIGRVVEWQRTADVRPFAGTPVRLRFVMKDADVFALQFGEQE